MKLKRKDAGVALFWSGGQAAGILIKGVRPFLEGESLRTVKPDAMIINKGEQKLCALGLVLARYAGGRELDAVGSGVVEDVNLFLQQSSH